MQLKAPSKKSISLRSILIHSLWITISGILLFRLATANTQRVLYAKIFAVSGCVLATAPWIIQLVVSTGIILLYKAEVCDLTWIITLPSDEHTDSPCCQDDHRRIAFPNVFYSHGKINPDKDWRLAIQTDAGNSTPRLLRNRTV